MTKKQVILALLLLLNLFKAIGVDGASLFFLLTQSKSEPVVGMQLNCSLFVKGLTERKKFFRLPCVQLCRY